MSCCCCCWCGSTAENNETEGGVVPSPRLSAAASPVGHSRLFRHPHIPTSTTTSSLLLLLHWYWCRCKRFDWARFDLTGLSVVRFAWARSGLTELSLVRFAWARFDLTGRGYIWLGAVRFDWARFDSIWLGAVRFDWAPCIGTTPHHCMLSLLLLLLLLLLLFLFLRMYMAGWVVAQSPGHTTRPLSGSRQRDNAWIIQTNKTQCIHTQTHTQTNTMRINKYNTYTPVRD